MTNEEQQAVSALKAAVDVMNSALAKCSSNGIEVDVNVETMRMESLGRECSVLLCHVSATAKKVLLP